MMQAPTRFIADPSLVAAMGERSRALAEERFDVHQVNRLMLERMGLAATAVGMAAVPP